jgi:hypothetical protein
VLNLGDFEPALKAIGIKFAAVADIGFQPPEGAGSATRRLGSDKIMLLGATSRPTSPPKENEKALRRLRETPRGWLFFSPEGRYTPGFRRRQP